MFGYTFVSKNWNDDSLESKWEENQENKEILL